MSWLSDDGDTMVLSGEEDVEELYAESSNQTLLVSVQLKQPSGLQKAQEELQRGVLAVFQKARHPEPKTLDPA